MPVGFIIPRANQQKPPCGARIDYSHPNAAGMVGCFLLNELAGNRVNNIGSLAGDNLFIANPVWNGGGSTNGVLFNGTTQYIQPNNGFYNIGDVSVVSSYI